MLENLLVALFVFVAFNAWILFGLLPIRILGVEWECDFSSKVMFCICIIGGPIMFTILLSIWLLWTTVRIEVWIIRRMWNALACIDGSVSSIF